MSVNVKVPANLEALRKRELIKLVRDLTMQGPQKKSPTCPSMANESHVQLKRRASPAEVSAVSAQKRRKVASPMQSQVDGVAPANRVVADAKMRRMQMANDFKTRWAKRQEERTQKRQTDLANHRTAPPETRIRTMPTTRKGFRFGCRDAVANLKITTPVFGDTNDDGSLKKEIALVENGGYTNPGELLLKIWISSKPVPRRLLVTEKRTNFTTGKVTENRSSALAKYLLRLKKTELVEEDKDGFRLSSTFKPWMLTGVPSTSAKFKPSVPGLFDARSFMSKTREYFREVHGQASGPRSVK